MNSNSAECSSRTLTSKNKLKEFTVVAFARELLTTQCHFSSTHFDVKTFRTTFSSLSKHKSVNEMAFPPHKKEKLKLPSSIESTYTECYPFISNSIPIPITTTAKVFRIANTFYHLTKEMKNVDTHTYRISLVTIKFNFFHFRHFEYKYAYVLYHRTAKNSRLVNRLWKPISSRIPS